jgi:hypothetical protein
MSTTKRTNPFVETNDGGNKLDLTVSTKEIAQDVFVGELVGIYDLFKSIYEGEGFAEHFTNSIESVVTYAYDYFFNPFVDIASKLIEYCEGWASLAFTNFKSNVKGGAGAVSNVFVGGNSSNGTKVI